MAVGVADGTARRGADTLSHGQSADHSSGGTARVTGPRHQCFSNGPGLEISGFTDHGRLCDDFRRPGGSLVVLGFIDRTDDGDFLPIFRQANRSGQFNGVNGRDLGYSSSSTAANRSGTMISMWPVR